jgi:hypothetical protein
MSLLIFFVFVIAIPIPSLPVEPNNLESVLKNHVSVRPCQEVHWTVNGTLGCNGWYVSPLTLSCTYDYDNITAVHYKYTGTNWTIYNNPFTIYTQGNISLQYYTVDRNGTVSPTLCFCLHIDYTPPQPNVTRDGRKIIVTTGDNDSGLDRVEFWIGPYLQFTQVFADPSGQQTAIWIISPLPLINVTITVIVYDLACNKYFYNYTSLSLDLHLNTILQRLVPRLLGLMEGCIASVSQESITDYPTNGSSFSKPSGVNWTVNGTHGAGAWYISPVILVCHSDDPMNVVYYRIDDSLWVLLQQPSLVISQQGNITFQWFWVDKNGNVSSIGTLWLPIDYTPPIVTLQNNRYGLWRWGISGSVYENISGLVGVEFWIGPYLQWFDNILMPPTSWYNFSWIQSVPYINASLTVVAYDAAGNQGSDSVPFTYSLDYHRGSGLLQALIQLLHTRK